MQIRYFANKGKTPVLEFLKELPVKDRLKMERCIELLSQMGVSLQMPHCRPIIGHHGLYELRSQTGGNIQRVFYITFHEWESGQPEAVLLHGFTKKSAKTPQSELDKAEKNRAIYLKQKGEANGHS